MIGNKTHNTKNEIAAQNPISFQIPTGGSLPIKVKTITSINIAQNQKWNNPLLFAGATFGLLSKNGSIIKITCAIANAIRPKSVGNGLRISYDHKKYHSG